MNKAFNRLSNLASYDDLVDSAGDKRALTLVQNGPRLKSQIVSVYEMHDFKDHPFKVIVDESLEALAESIKNRGIIHPPIVRKASDGFEIISGHRRRLASIKAGLTSIPVYVVDVTDEEATIMMTDANLYQRENLLPSEKAKAYRRKSDAIKRHSGIKGKYTIEEIGEGTKDSSTMIKRYLRLSYLSDELLELVDSKKITFEPAIQLSYLDKGNQELMYDLINELKITVNITQAKEIRSLSEEATLNRENAIAVLLSKKPNGFKVTLKSDFLNRYFDEDEELKDIEDVIKKALDAYFGKVS